MQVFGDSKDFDPVFSQLNKSESLSKNIQGVITSLKNDKVVGQRIKYKQIPKYYIKRHNVDNAFRIPLPEGWRLIYTITIFQGYRTAFLLELFDHKNYERRFKY